MLLLYPWHITGVNQASSIYIPLCFYFIHPSFRWMAEIVLFTFHYASTLSCRRAARQTAQKTFTFHYASTLSDKPS